MARDEQRFENTYVEGFWYSDGEPHFPMPIAYDGPWPNKKQFLKKLVEVESRCQVIAYRGWSTCRMCSAHNGNETFRTGDWSWPSGYRHYIEEHGVRPSTAFEQTIMRY